MFAFFRSHFDCTQAITLSRSTFLLTHVIAPALLFSITFIGLESSGLDIWLGAHFYDPAQQLWPYKDQWLIQKVLHKGGRLAFFGIIAIILWLIARSFATPSLKNYRHSLIYLALASISGPLIVMFLKNHTHIYCPWDLQFFGSTKPYIRWFDSVPTAAPVGHCFPAAHASSGYAFISFYFFFLSTHPHLKWRGLSFGLGLGLLYGLTQQMRGAHFLSHDVASLAICWFMTLLLFWLFFKRRVQWL